MRNPSYSFCPPLAPTTTSAPQQTHRVAAHADGRAELGQLGRLLKDLRRDAVPPQGEPEDSPPTPARTTATDSSRTAIRPM